MSELSEKELLLLSNYLYIDKCTEYGTINELLDSCRDLEGNISKDRVAGLGIGGCMSTEEGLDLLQDIDASSEEFKSLNVSRSIDDGGIRAVCFTKDGDDANATVVFRGTGGSYEAWADNVRGEYMTDTKMQKLADDFVRYDCGVYDNITVSGHSKGGNMAQYVTVTNTGRVGRCISFDGQGFGNGFFGAYKSTIPEASGHIKSVSAHNDYVNILLNSIAGECVYVRNIRNDAVGRHSSYALLKSCEFDDEGNIVNTTDQEALMRTASKMGKGLTGMLDHLPGTGNKSVSELLASSAAAVFSDEFDSEYENSRILEAAEGVGAYTAELAGFDMGGAYDVATVADSVYVDINGLCRAQEELVWMKAQLEEVSDTLSRLRGKLNYRAASRLAVDTILHKQENILLREENKLTVYTQALADIAKLYGECENELVERIRGAAV